MKEIDEYVVCSVKNLSGEISGKNLRNLQNLRIGKIEINCGKNRRNQLSIQMQDKEILTFRDKINEARMNIDVLSIDDQTLGDGWPGKNFEDIKNNFRKVIDIANLLGTEVIRWTTGLIEEKTLSSDKSSIRDLFSILGQYAKGKGLEIGLESVDGVLMEIEKTKEFLNDIRCDCIGLSFNPSKFISSGQGRNKQKIREFDDYLHRDAMEKWFTPEELKRISVHNDIAPTLGKFIKCLYLVNYKQIGNEYKYCGILEGTIDTLLILGQLFGWSLSPNKHIIVEDPVLALCYQNGKVEFETNCYLTAVTDIMERKKCGLEPGGEGKAFFIPQEVPSWEMVTLTLSFIVGEGGISTGGGIKIQSCHSKRRVSPQIYNPKGNGYVTVSTSRKGVGLQKFVVPSPLATIIIQINKGSLLKGDEIRVVIGDKSYGGKGIRMEPSPMEEEFLMGMNKDGIGDYKLVERLILKIVGGEAKRLHILSPSTIQKREDFKIGVVAEDKSGYPSIGYKGIVELETKENIKVIPERYRYKEIDRGNHWFNGKIEKEGIHYITVKDKENGFVVRSNPVICSSHFNYKIFWGDIHAHSTLSDGINSIDFLYKHARDVAKLDFAAAADHGSIFNNAVWEKTKRTIKKYYEDGKFVALLGSEVNPKEGHKNICFKGLNAPSLGKEKSNQLNKVWEHLQKYKGLLVHHQMATASPFVDWDHCNPEVERLVEIVSCHGNNEDMSTTSSIYPPKEGHYVQDALTRGYRFGFCASSDTHDSHCGYTPYGYCRYSPIVGVLAKKLSRDSIFEALWNRRCYATTGARIILNFKLNGRIMGEEIEIKEKECPRNIEVKVMGTEKIKRIDIIRNNKKIYIHKGKSNIEEFKWQDKDDMHLISLRDKSQHPLFIFYYARILQEDGEMAWSSPIWIKLKENYRRGDQLCKRKKQKRLY